MFKAKIGALLFGIIFLLFASPVKAQEVVLPADLSLSGLTPITPLTLDSPGQNQSFLRSVTFETPQPLTLYPKPDLASNDVSDILTPKLSLNIPVPTPTPSPTPTPTHVPIPSSTPTPTPVDTPIPVQTNSGGLNASLLFSMVQNYRTAHGLPVFQQDDRTCSVAQTRAPAVNEEIADGHMHSGLAAMNLPYWNTENIISMRTESEAFNWWINDTVHREAILGNFKYSCLACSGNSCAEEFTDFTPK